MNESIEKKKRKKIERTREIHTRNGGDQRCICVVVERNEKLQDVAALSFYVAAKTPECRLDTRSNRCDALNIQSRFSTRLRFIIGTDDGDVFLPAVDANQVVKLMQVFEGDVLPFKGYDALRVLEVAAANVGRNTVQVMNEARGGPIGWRELGDKSTDF